ncbi:MAG: SGNH/GDSL hydrolase family protein [Candidatus Omnitrophota bacterium]
MKKIIKNICFLTIPSIIVAILILELFVRVTWDKKQGTPGLVLTHPTRIETLAPNYKGYFAGQPLKVNNLGFRDDQDYDIVKLPGTYRIIVLGDSVTFGHGCKFDETWPYLLRKDLERHDSSVDWQVWNLGVPGYDNVLALRTLEELGPKYKPDLVIVGFYENDLIAWNYHSKQQTSKLVYNIKRFLKQNFYLYTKLRYAYNVISNLKAGSQYQCEREAMLLKKPDKEVAPVDLSKLELKHRLPGAPQTPRTDRVYTYLKDGEASLRQSVDMFKEYGSKGTYKIVYFINISPDIDMEKDVFIDGVHNEMNDFFVHLFNKDFPTVSSYDAFWSYKPSEVPGSDGHSLGAANKVKADVLSDFLIRQGILSSRAPSSLTTKSH